LAASHAIVIADGATIAWAPGDRIILGRQRC
jgi:hypothetical protein